MNIVDKVKSFYDDPYNRNNIYYNKKTYQIAYSKLMSPEDDGFRKGMLGAFDIETNKVICRTFDNISIGLNKRGFYSLTFEEFKNHWVPFIRDNKLSELTGGKVTELTKSVLDMTDEENKKKEYKRLIKEAITKSKTDINPLIEIVHSLSRKGISVDEIKSMV